MRPTPKTPSLLTALRQTLGEIHDVVLEARQMQRAMRRRYPHLIDE
ncbi:hypothetical protein [Prosthecomicrobium sp. N25]